MKSNIWNNKASCEVQYYAYLGGTTTVSPSFSNACARLGAFGEYQPPAAADLGLMRYIYWHKYLAGIEKEPHVSYLQKENFAQGTSGFVVINTFPKIKP
jgi:hypothetical protein